MEIQLSPDARRQLNRFCRQYLQFQLDLEYPDENQLRSDIFQKCIYSRLFEKDAIEYTPPERFQLRVLKELTQRIEESIEDWEEEVGFYFVVRSYKLISTVFVDYFNILDQIMILFYSSQEDLWLIVSNIRIVMHLISHVLLRL